MEWLNSLRGASLAALVIKLVLAVIFGGAIGLERGGKRRPAGFRTHILVCMGATMAMCISRYCIEVLGITVDVSRLGAQVINGIGFLGAGTIIVTKHNQIKGLTTAAGLWASACMGLAIGAGFYECILLGLGLILLCVWLLPAVEAALIERAKNINLYIEFDSLDHMGQIISSIKGLDLDIHQVDINRGKNGAHPSAILALRLRQRRGRSQVLAAISKLDCIRTIDEI